jgi:eukaryotic-like serine/threonine-protein kinase
LKPANVMVGTDGAVKVLDFGLAKLMSGDATSDEETVTRVVDVGLSAPGTVAGTAAYMAPEQAAGGKVDARSDIFSFGALVYEMLTGARPFAGASREDTLAAVLRAQPTPPTAILPGLPTDLEKVVLRCLRKDPRQTLPAHRRRENCAAGHQGGIGLGRRSVCATRAHAS